MSEQTADPEQQAAQTSDGAKPAAEGAAQDGNSAAAEEAPEDPFQQQLREKEKQVRASSYVPAQGLHTAI